MPPVSPCLTPPAARIASAIGIMMNAVAVLEITVEMAAVAAITASSSCQQLALARRVIASARRRWSPVRSIASARNAPPMNRNMIGE